VGEFGVGFVGAKGWFFDGFVAGDVEAGGDGVAGWGEAEVGDFGVVVGFKVGGGLQAGGEGGFGPGG